MYTVIAFDVSDDKRRYRLVREVEARASRVQYSVFEASRLDRTALQRLRSDCERFIDPRTDSLRYYRLCAACRRRIIHVGVGLAPLPNPEGFDIV